MEGRGKQLSPVLKKAQQQINILKGIESLLDVLLELKYFTPMQREFLDRFIHKSPSALEVVSATAGGNHGIGPVEKRSYEYNYESESDVQSLPTQKGPSTPISRVKVSSSPAASFSMNSSINLAHHDGSIIKQSFDQQSSASTQESTACLPLDQIPNPKLKAFQERCEKAGVRSNIDLTRNTQRMKNISSGPENKVNNEKAPGSHAVITKSLSKIEKKAFLAESWDEFTNTAAAMKFDPKKYGHPGRSTIPVGGAAVTLTKGLLHKSSVDESATPSQDMAQSAARFRETRAFVTSNKDHELHGHGEVNQSKSAKSNRKEEAVTDSLARYGKAVNMMAKMGYAGGGLGRSGNGITEPISLLPMTKGEGIGSGALNDENLNVCTSTGISPKSPAAWDHSVKLTDKQIKQFNVIRGQPIDLADGGHSAASKTAPMTLDNSPIHVRLIEDGPSLSLGGSRNVRSIQFRANVKSVVGGHKVTHHFPGLIVESLMSREEHGRLIRVKKGDRLEITERDAGIFYHAINHTNHRNGLVQISDLEMLEEPKYDETLHGAGYW